MAVSLTGPIYGLPRYSAALPDELSLSPGMKLVVLRIYDDAWSVFPERVSDVPLALADPFCCSSLGGLVKSSQETKGISADKELSL